MIQPLGKMLKPSTVQTIYEQVEFQRVNRPSWVAYHLPQVDKRGRLEYGDVEGIGEREADSLRHLLVSQIQFGRKQLARARGRSVSFLTDSPKEGDDETSGSEWEIRNRQMEEALADLCNVFHMTYPL